MGYPNDFDVPAFSAGKTVALTRTVSVWILIVFFFIVVSCGFLLFGRHLQKNFPFLVSVDPATDEWTVVAYPNEKQKPIPQYRYIQEKLVNDFVKDWFTISKNQELNKQVWESCSVEDCNEPEFFNPANKNCALACKSSKEVFTVFTTKVLPDYKARIKQANEIWRIPQGVTIINPRSVYENQSEWQVYTTIDSSVNGSFSVMIFITVDRDTNLYHSTFGYYISKFNAYRIAR